MSEYVAVRLSEMQQLEAMILRAIELSNREAKQLERARTKLKAYKQQQKGLVQNQRLLKLEYAALKGKYDDALRVIKQLDALLAVRRAEEISRLPQVPDATVYGPGSSC